VAAKPPEGSSAGTFYFTSFIQSAKIKNFIFLFGSICLIIKTASTPPPADPIFSRSFPVAVSPPTCKKEVIL